MARNWSESKACVAAKSDEHLEHAFVISHFFPSHVMKKASPAFESEARTCRAEAEAALAEAEAALAAAAACPVDDGDKTASPAPPPAAVADPATEAQA